MSIKSAVCVRYAVVLGACILSQTVSTTAKTIFCIADGTQISAERFDSKDGKFLLYLSGSPTPLEYPASSIKGIDVPCPETAPVVSVVPRFGIHGSNTIGERLMPMLIEDFGAKKLGMKPASKITGKEEQEITLRTAAGPRAIIDFAAHGSGTATPGLVEGKAVIGMASRGLNDAEAKLVDDRFKVAIRTPGNEHVLALDGIAVIVNPGNPVGQLNLDQIAQIFSGQISNWKDVGGRDGSINVLRRDNASGTWDTFNSLVLAPRQLKISPSAKPYESSETLSSDVAKDVNAIGFIGLPYINKNHPLVITSQCGITSSPTTFTVKSEQYPLARRLYLYTIGTPNEPLARDLLQFALSDDAQPTIEEAEFIDQRIILADAEDQRSWAESLRSNPDQGLPAQKQVPRSAVEDFARFANSARRSSIVFRFERGSSQLDTRAVQDVGRLARFISGGGAGKKQFWIVGFADADGDWNLNSRLASARAAQVAGELARSGVRVPSQNIKTVSYMAPTACNDTDAGKAKNRRAEVWFER